MTDDENALLAHRYDLAINAIEHARVCIKDLRGDMALRALDIATHQIEKLKPATNA